MDARLPTVEAALAAPQGSAQGLESGNLAHVQHRL